MICDNCKMEILAGEKCHVEITYLVSEKIGVDYCEKCCTELGKKPNAEAGGIVNKNVSLQ